MNFDQYRMLAEISFEQAMLSLKMAYLLGHVNEYSISPEDLKEMTPALHKALQDAEKRSVEFDRLVKDTLESIRGYHSKRQPRNDEFIRVLCRRIGRLMDERGLDPQDVKHFRDPEMN